MFEKVSQWGKINIPNSIQILLNTPKKERIKRNALNKKLYVNKILNDETYDVLISPDLVIYNYGRISPDDASKSIVKYFLDYSGKEIDRGRTLYWNNYQKNNSPPN